jgi:biotin carboxyl carrier protein
MRYVTTVDDRSFAVEIVREGEVRIDGQLHAADMRHIEPLSLYSLLIDNVSHEIFIEEQEGRYGVVLRGKLYAVQVQDERAGGETTLRTTPAAAGREILIEAPMPGVVVEVFVTAAQRVRAGEALLILESMKMANRLSCPRDGVVKVVHVTAGSHVGGGQVLITVST